MIRSQVIEIQPFSPKQYSKSNTKNSVKFTATPIFSNCADISNIFSTSTVQFIEILQFYQAKYSNKCEITEKQDFSTKSIHELLSKDQKKIVFTPYFRNSDGFY